MMKRREFITLLGGAVVAWPVATLAQQPAMPVIGVLGIGPPESNAKQLASFRNGLSRSGPSPGNGPGRDWNCGRRARGQGSHNDNTDRIRERERPG